MAQKDSGDWRAALNKNLKGTGYFVSQTDPIQFDPLEYLRWRNTDKATTQSTMKSEWGRWLQYFRGCSIQQLRERAMAAPSMNSSIIATYLEEKLNAERLKRKNIDRGVECQASGISQRTRASRKARSVAFKEPIFSTTNNKTQTSAVEDLPGNDNEDLHGSNNDVSDSLSSTQPMKPVHKAVAILEADFLSESGSEYVDSKPSSARSSLNSIDFHHINHLVGPGTTSSKLSTNDRLTLDNIDISKILMEARMSLIKKQDELNDVSDLLNQTEEGLVVDLLCHYSQRSSLWLQSASYPTPPSTLVQNEDTYTQAIVKGIIFSVVCDLELLDHWNRDPLPVPLGFEEVYNPDYFGEYDGFPVLLVEIKKPGIMDDSLEGDQRRLPCMQKLMLDRMLAAGVESPKVVGFLIKRDRCEISVMEIEHEALYVVKLVRVFGLPQNNLELGLLCPALGPLKYAHEIVSSTLNSIKTRNGRQNLKKYWCRPSYYVKGIRIPPE
ncbi:hypothetical protein BGW38_004934 [Lunasporangiospora selenospora]|uniref:Uncharacterized protein n=1 Tax=Lunasporangiospora selenospora TaxID=979761 RepID=A0A9P6KBU7_9FUNG|nr:hypothetical protein BGW38_004934 [Lunasporangiospora selenospora]